MEKLVEKVKKECAEGYFAPGEESGIIPLGATDVESMYIYLFLSPHMHFSKWNLVLPKALRELVKNPNEGLCEKLKQLYLFHYAVNKNSMERNFKDWVRYSDELKTGQFMEKFSEFINNGSCIYPRFTGTGPRVDIDLPVLLGKKDTMQEAMDFLKKEPEHTMDFYTEILKGRHQGDAEFVRENILTIHIYDLLKKPKKIIYSQ